MRQAILLDTDIGTDIDDVYALLLAVVSPELDLMGVSTVNNDTLLRSRIATRLLKLLGRPDIQVVPGRGDSYTPGVRLGWMGHEGVGVDLTDTSAKPSQGSLPELVAACVQACVRRGTALTLVTIGAMTNAAWLLETLPPDIIGGIGHIVAMASTFDGYGDANAAREHNVACDSVAFERVVHSGVPVTLVGLNVTRRTEMTAERLAKVEAIGGPLADALSGMHRIWFRQIGRESSPMHDALAVAAVFRPDLIATKSVLPEVRGFDGTVVYNAPDAVQVTSVEIAVDVQIDAYHELLYARVTAAVEAARRRAEEP